MITVYKTKGAQVNCLKVEKWAMSENIPELNEIKQEFVDDMCFDMAKIDEADKEAKEFYESVCYSWSHCDMSSALAELAQDESKRSESHPIDDVWGLIDGLWYKLHGSIDEIFEELV